MSEQPSPLPITARFMSRRHWSRFSYRFTALLFLGGGMLVGGGLIGSGIGKVINKSADLTTAPTILLGLFIALWVILSASATFVTASTYTLDQDGLRARVLPWMTLLISWEAIEQGQVAVHQTPLPYRKLEEGERLVTVQVAGLTALHRLAALYYGFGFRPLLILTPDHDHYQELAEQLGLRQEVASLFPAPGASAPSAPAESHNTTE